MDRSSLKANVEAARANLRAAEQALEDSYGPTLPAFATLLLVMFSADEARRVVLYNLRRFHDELPGKGSTEAEVARAVARCFIEAEKSAADLREILINERPNRRRDIDVFMVKWPF